MILVGKHYMPRKLLNHCSLLSALMRFVMKLNLSTEELELIRDMDKNCSKHISVVNDIFSWEKELMKSMVGYEEGSVLCSSVQVMAAIAKISIDAAKRVL
jgi:aristolochene synthase